MTSTAAPERPLPKHIGLIGFDDVAALDLVGVMDAFRVGDGAPSGQPPRRYRLSVVAASDAPFRAESGLRLAPDHAFADAPAFDTIVVPGGFGLRQPQTNAVVAAWLTERAPHTRRMVSVCTGLYGLAATGLMDGRRATTHWRHAADAAKRFPKLRIEPDAIFIKDGKFHTSAGMTAGIDLALALIEEDHGPAAAMATARHLVVYMRRSGGQLQYSEPLRAQTQAGDRFADLAARMLGDLAADWSVEAMAERSGFSPRQFSRRFKAAFALPPAAYVEMLRLDEARLRLASGGDGIARIAHAVGFSSDDAFRRAFERRFGVTPTAYRGRFSQPSTPLRRSLTMKRAHSLAACGVAAAVSALVLTGSGGFAQPADPEGAPRYDAAGKLLPVGDYRDWVFLSSGLDMSYSDAPAPAGSHEFDNVFAPRAAVAAFKRTGVWPDKTVLIVEVRGGATKGSINKQGQYQTNPVVAVEAHVKDQARFKGGWGFFALGAEKPAAQIPYTAACYSCHEQHAAADTTFVQFYPTLLPVATKLGTLSKAYLADPTPPVGK